MQWTRISNQSLSSNEFPIKKSVYVDMNLRTLMQIRFANNFRILFNFVAKHIIPFWWRWDLFGNDFKKRRLVAKGKYFLFSSSIYIEETGQYYLFLLAMY